MSQAKSDDPRAPLSDTVLGKMVVEQGLATAAEVQDCLSQGQTSGGSGTSGTSGASGASGGGSAVKTASLAQLLVANGLVTQRQLDRLRPATDQSTPEQQIPGFQIIKRLGAGAMATVYLAKQLSLDRLVAIKILPLKSNANPEFIERFYAEGRAAAKLNHANIVGALDVGKAGEFHYFVMEYVQGRTVFDDIAGGKRYTEAGALQIIIQVARALDHAHKAGFIHRDVKPKNIMITKEGVAKLADMGLARAVSDREAAEAEQGKAYGTPYYISPEQIRGEINVDFRADIYSLGATFYHIVTGQVPFDGPNPSAVMHKHLKATLVPPDHLNPKLSAGISEIIEVCMAKERNQRYQSTADLLEDLEAVARGEPPLQARKGFDLAALAALEDAPTTPNVAVADTPEAPAPVPAPLPLTRQPFFWFAVSGWTLTAILLIVIVLLIAKRQ